MNWTQFLPLILIFLMNFPASAAERMSLNSFLDKARRQNLDLKIENATSEEFKAKASGLNIPAPMLGVIQMTDRSGESSQGYEISQSIPFPTKISGEYSARQFESKAQDQMRLARENEVMAQAKLLYIDLWSKQEKQSLLQMKKEIIRHHVNLTRSGVRSDSFATIHLLKAESDSDLLENEMESNQQQIREAQARIAAFLNVDPNNFEITTEEPPMSIEPNVDSLRHSHQLKSAEFKLEGFKSKELESKSTWFPDLNVKYRKLGDTSVTDSELMVGVTLPFVFFWEPNSNSRSAAARRSQAEFELEKTRRNIEADTTSFTSRAESLRKQIATLKDKLIPRAEKRVRVIRNLAPRDMETLKDHFETMDALPNLKLKSLELRLEYEQVVSNLEKYTVRAKEHHE